MKEDISEQLDLDEEQSFQAIEGVRSMDCSED